MGPRREWLFLSRVRFCDRHVADSHQYLEVRQEGSRQGDKGERGPERRADALLGHERSLINRMPSSPGMCKQSHVGHLSAMRKSRCCICLNHVCCSMDLTCNTLTPCTGSLPQRPEGPQARPCGHVRGPRWDTGASKEWARGQGKAEKPEHQHVGETIQAAANPGWLRNHSSSSASPRHECSFIRVSWHRYRLPLLPYLTLPSLRVCSGP